MDFLSSESEEQGPERKDSKKSSIPQKSFARRQKREADIRKEKRSMSLKRRRVNMIDFDDVASNDGSTWNETMITEAIQSLREVGSESCTKGLEILRNALCSADAPIQLAINLGCIPSLIQLLRLPNSALQSDVVWCLTNLASGTHEETRHVLDAVPDLLFLISGEDKSLAEQACWAIGNIAGDGDQYRMTMIKNGAVLPIMKFLFDSVSAVDERSSVTRSEAAMAQAQTAAWALSNLSRGSTTAAVFLETGMVPPLVSLIGHPNRELAVEIWWIFTFLTAKEDISVQQFLDMGLTKRVAAAAETTFNPRDVSSIPLVRALGNLSSGPENWMDFIIAEPAIINCLMACTDQDTTNRAIMKETTWVLANLLGGTEHQRRSMLNTNVIESILSVFYCDYFDAQRESVFALSHACHSIEVVMRFIGEGAEDLLLQLIQFLRIPDEEVRASSLEIISALIFASPDTKNEVLRLCINLDLLDTLENSQYGPAGDERLKQTVSTLIGELDAFDDDGIDKADANSESEFEMESNSFYGENNRGARSRGIDNKPSWMSRCPP